MFANAREKVAVYPSVRFIDTEATEAAADGVIAGWIASPGARLRAERHVKRYET
ncbi:MAG: hypothetical protein ACXWKP_20520 [Bradyrhizobium sp.]